MGVIGSAAPHIFFLNGVERGGGGGIKTSKQQYRCSIKPTALKSPSPYWTTLQAEIEAHLKDSIPLKEPLVVFEPMHHLVFSAPQTTVPALCLAACELVGGHRNRAMAAASALLLMHSASYTHEHLGLGPNATAGIDLLTGDGIMPFGFELLARSDDEGESSERILRVMVEISRAFGSRGIIDAQYRRKAASDGEDMRQYVEKYEGGLHGCAGACGAVLGGGSEEEIERLRKYGFYVGLGLKQPFLRGDKQVEARNKALHELHYFKDIGKNVDAISTFIHI